MKIINKKYKLILFALTFTIGAGIWSCSDDEDVDRVSLSSEQLLPKVTAISPTSGILGTEVTIAGENFSEATDDIIINFVGTDTPAVVTAASKTSITATVPSGAITGELSILVGRSKVQGGPLFTVVPPDGISYNVSSGIAGTEITISGANFSTELSDNAISFNGVEAEIVAATPTTLTTVVPFGATTGAIIVTVDGQEGIGPEFTVPLPTITGYDIATGITGDIITITGTNFSPDADNMVVTFEGAAEAELTEATATSITTTVPFGAFTGVIEVNVAGQTAGGPEFSIPIVTLGIGIADDLDDLEENTTRDGLVFDNSDLELGETERGNLYNIGLRYRNVSIPAGTVITSAYIQFQADDDGDEPTQMTIYGHNVPDSPPFTFLQSDVKQRPITSSNVVWEIDTWVKGDRDEAQRTPDITAIVQEIIDNGDWESGNNMSFILEPTGVSEFATGSGQGREAEADPGDDSATLIIVFSTLQ